MSTQPGAGPGASDDDGRDVPDEPSHDDAGPAEPDVEPDADVEPDVVTPDDTEPGQEPSPAADVPEADTDADIGEPAAPVQEAADVDAPDDPGDEAAETATGAEELAEPVGEPGPEEVPDPEEVRDDEAADPDGPDGQEPLPAAAPSGWRRLGAALHPRMTRSQVLAGVLCAALGFALVVQVQQSASDQLSSARQEDLVRLLDEVTDRAEQLGDEVAGLESTRDELLSGSGQAQSALELAQQRAESEGILSGRLPAQGPGVILTIEDPSGGLEASQLFNVLEELRNAGAEVVQVNEVRLVTSTWFRDEDSGIVVDGTPLESPYEWTVIGDPETLDRALEIPGGALATVRTAGADATTERRDEVTITAVTDPQEPEYAKPERSGE